MKKKQVNRFGHAGKDRYEKEAYRNFLTSKFSLDKTENDPIDTNKTSESSFEDERESIGKIQKKSTWLKTKDFLYDNWVIAIISGVLFLILGGYVVLYREQGVQDFKINTIKDDITTIQSENNKDEESFGILKEKFDIFSTEVSKDIEYIKKALKL
jgi:hypothetical protein